MSESEPTVTRNEAASRFEIDVDGTRAGIAEYKLDGTTFVFTHTKVEDAFEGKGIGSRLAAGSLDQVRETGGTVVAQCPFIAGYIEGHQQYADLLEQAPS